MFDSAAPGHAEGKWVLWHEMSGAAPSLPKNLHEWRSGESFTTVAMILEHSWDYAAIDVTNAVGATSCWLDKYRSLSMWYIGDRPAGIPQLEPSIIRMLRFGA